MQPGPLAAPFLLLLFFIRIGRADVVFTAEACDRLTFGLRGIQGDSTRYKQCGPSGKVWIVPCAPKMSFDPIEKVCKEVEELQPFRRMEKFQGRSRRPIITTPATQPAEEFVFSTHRPKRPRIKGKGKKKITTTPPTTIQNFVTEAFPEELQPEEEQIAALPAFPRPGATAATTIRPEYTVKYNGENMTEEELLRRLVDLVKGQKATAAKEKADKEDREKRRLEEEQRILEEERRRRQEEAQQRVEEDRRRQEEARQKEEAERRRQEEERKRQEEARLEKKRLDEERRKVWEEKQRKKEEERRLAVERAELARRQEEEAERKRQEEEERKRREEEEWKRRQVEEAERLRRIEEQEEMARRKQEEEMRVAIAKAEQERMEQMRRIEEAKREQERLERIRKEEKERREKEKEELMRRERERAERMKQEMERQLELERREMERQMVFNRMATTTTATPDFEIIRFPPATRLQGSVIPPLPTTPSTIEGNWVTAENSWKPPIDVYTSSREIFPKTTPVPRVLEGCIPNGDCPFSYDGDHFCAHPDNPMMYLQCAPMIGRRGRWTVRHCPDGLMFSNHLGRCEKDPFSAYNPNQRVIIPRLPEETNHVTWKGNREIVTVTPVYTHPANGIHNTIDSFPKDLLPVVAPIHPGDLFKPKQTISEFDDYEELDLSKIHPLFPRVQPSFINNFLPFQPLQEGEKEKEDDNILGAVFKPFFKKMALKQTKNFLDRVLSDEEIRRLEEEADRLRGEGTSHN